MRTYPNWPIPWTIPLPVLLLVLASCDRGTDLPPEGDRSFEAAAPAEERPAPAPAEPSAHLLDAIREHVAASGDSMVPPFRYTLTDLNEDGREEAIVLLSGPGHCRADGCTLLVLRGDDEGSLLISGSTATTEPIRVSSDRTSGWQNLIVRSGTGGDVLMRYDGTGYPPDPSSQAPATPAQVSAAQPLELTEVSGPTPQ